MDIAILSDTHIPDQADVGRAEGATMMTATVEASDLDVTVHER